ncbi:MAG: ABC transporter permease [Vagococcus sp.]|uniref:ABC transporter permease n=1 Tax=Vagococcus sp. TaxID=1933889 RepID=UPI002FC7576C
MNLFYKNRLALHQKHMMRYMKYVLNDHFLLVMIVAMGGFALYYSEFVKQLDQTFIYGRLFVILLWFLILFVGKVATLLKEPDMIFLLPKERQMTSYMKKAYQHSIWLPLIVITLTVGITMPLLVATTPLGFNDFYPLVLNLWLLKLGYLMIQLQKVYLNTESSTRLQLIIFVISSFLSISLNLYFNPWSGIIISLLFVAFSSFKSKDSLGKNPLDWEKAIAFERKRLKKIYSFINLFTDVPGLSSDVKRRTYMDPLLKRIKKEQGQTFTYLYSRVFLRGTEFSGLAIRLTVIGSLFLFFSDQLILNGIISVLFIYLIGFQLLPIYSEFDYMLMTHLYPVKREQKVRAVEKLIQIVLSVTIAIFSVLLLIRLQDKVGALMIIGMMLIEGIVFTKMYAPKRLKKLEKSLI